MSEYNGLQYHLIKSECKSYEKIESLDFIQQVMQKKSLVVVYTVYEVLFGYFSGGTYRFYENKTIPGIQYIDKIRVFNSEEEMFVWKSENVLKGRYRNDTKGEETAVIDAHQVIFGTKINRICDDFIRLTEERGTDLILPLKEELSVNNGKNRIRLFTRNYIGNNGNYQATYIDSRFIGFSYGENCQIIGG